MWKLAKPKLEDSINDLTAVEQHSRDITHADIPGIEAMYRQYDSQGGVVTDAQHTRISAKAAKGLRNAYDKTYESGHHANIRGSIKQSADKCPMCSIGNASTLDHYMEKEKYKALAVCRQNLVPMCYDCNTTRNKNKLAHTNMLHAYYDKLPDDRKWLTVDLKFGAGALVAKFQPDPNVLTDPTLYRKAQKTIDGLDLNESFRKEITSFLSGIIYGKGANDILLVAILKEKAEKFSGNPCYGINHWKTVLLKALADTPNLTTAHLSTYITRR